MAGAQPREAAKGDHSAWQSTVAALDFAPKKRAGQVNPAGQFQ